MVPRVLRFIQEHHRRPLPEEIDLDYDPRYIQYCCQAATILGFLASDDGVTLTENGHLLLTLEPDLQQLRLICAFEASRLGQAWIAWAGKKELNEVDPTSSHDFLKAMGNPVATTTDRRAQTLSSWAQKFSKLREEAKPPHQRKKPAFCFQPQQPRRPDALNEITIFDAGGSGRVLAKLVPGTYRLRIATGFFTIQGYQLLAQYISQAETYLLIGFEERNPYARQSRYAAQTLLRWFEESLDRGVPSSEKRAAIKRLHSEVLKSLVGVRYYEPKYIEGLHAKAYIFDEYSAYVTSANLTKTGLEKNIEVGHVVTAKEEVRFYRETFEQHFGASVPITLPILQALEKSWVFQEPLSPFLLFLKVMHELFERLPELRTKSSYKLAEFQKRIVRPVMAKLLAYRGAMLISPTGTGKTVMAGHIAAYFAQEHVQRIIVICPNKSLEQDWKATMRRFGRSIEVVRHGILQNKGTKTSEKRRKLLEIINNPQETDLVIVDECHHFRNLTSQGRGNLRQLLKPDNEARRPYCLLLTATPISTGLENINALLELINRDRIETIHQLDKVPNAVNVTLPFILKNFGVTLKGHGKLALRYGDELLYFPSMNFNTVTYQSPMHDAFDLIARLPLKFELEFDQSNQGAAVAVQLALGTGSWQPRSPTRSVRDLALLRTILARRAESSPRALASSIDRLLAGIQSNRLKPMQPEVLTQGLQDLKAMACAAEQDTKLRRLATLLREDSIKNQKTLIFSESTETVEYVYNYLSQNLPKRKMQFLIGETKNRKAILRRFAPVGQKVPIEEQTHPIAVLIASDAIAEGENLQDATVVINYDLAWTPLRLIQRIGRVDRPTQKPRHVSVWNFYPGSERYEELVRIWGRLDDRSDDVEVLTQARVIGDHERIPEQLDPEDVGLVKALMETGDYNQFLENLLPTSGFMQIWASATDEELKKARELPNNVRAGKHGPEAGYYVLIRQGEYNYSLFRRHSDRQLIAGPREQPHEFFVDHYVSSIRSTPSISIPGDFDDELQQLVSEWATSAQLDLDTLTVVAAEYIAKP